MGEWREGFFVFSAVLKNMCIFAVGLVTEGDYVSFCKHERYALDVSKGNNVKFIDSPAAVSSAKKAVHTEPLYGAKVVWEGRRPLEQSQKTCQTTVNYHTGLSEPRSPRGKGGNYL